MAAGTGATSGGSDSGNGNGSDSGSGCGNGASKDQIGQPLQHLEESSRLFD